MILPFRPLEGNLLNTAESRKIMGHKSTKRFVPDRGTDCTESKQHLAHLHIKPRKQETLRFIAGSLVSVHVAVGLNSTRRFYPLMFGVSALNFRNTLGEDKKKKKGQHSATHTHTPTCPTMTSPAGWI